MVHLVDMVDGRDIVTALDIGTHATMHIFCMLSRSSPTTLFNYQPSLSCGVAVMLYTLHYFLP